MASSSLAPYKNNSTAVTFAYVGPISNGAQYKVSGRALACPHEITIEKFIGASGSAANDRVRITVRRVERNTTTDKLATLKTSLEISIPKDLSILDTTAQLEQLALMSSLLNDSTAMAATTAARTNIVEGRDL